ncbi:MAG: nucleotide exchange factor GrpE [Planctomycetes bacterium]|nr:nucleotide exchange factor GrpE [Planctomycetota bacterium]
MARKTKKQDQDLPLEESAAESEVEQDAREAKPGATDGEPAAEQDDYHARWQRAQADYKNLRRRTLADIDSAVRRATQPLLLALLTAIDHLEMALAAPTESEEARNLAIGVGMTRDELLKSLETHGVKPIPEGGEFDPELHQAMATVQSDELEPGQIAATIRTGYKWGEHVLRHAQVQVVAEEQPAAPQPAAPQNGDGDEAEQA